MQFSLSIECDSFSDNPGPVIAQLLADAQDEILNEDSGVLEVDGVIVGSYQLNE